MKSKEEIEKMIKELEERKSGSSNMNYEIGGSIDALKWVLGEKEFLVSGLRY